MEIKEPFFHMQMEETHQPTTTNKQPFTLCVLIRLGLIQYQILHLIKTVKKNF